MFSLIKSFFGYAQPSHAKYFEADEDGKIRYLNETFNPPRLVHTRADFIAVKYPEIWDKYKPDKFGIVTFPIKVIWNRYDDEEYYRLKMEVQYMDEMLRIMDENYCQWEIIDNEIELPDETYFFNNNQFMNDWIYNYFRFRFIQVEPSNIAM